MIQSAPHHNILYLTEQIRISARLQLYKLNPLPIVKLKLRYAHTNFEVQLILKIFKISASHFLGFTHNDEQITNGNADVRLQQKITDSILSE